MRPMTLRRSASWITVALAVMTAASVLFLNCVRAQQDEPVPVLRGADAAPADEFQPARDRLIAHLMRAGYLKTEPVIKAMRDTKRHLFVPEKLWPYAYEDHPLPIGHDQTISAPSIVALMTELIEPKPEKVILEIGTGSGYQAAVLSPLCKHVYTIEILEPLATGATKILKDLGYKNVTVRCGDGYKGWPEHAPFDGIMVTCAPEKVPQPLVEQLKEGGRMVIPKGKGLDQNLYVMQKVNGQLEETFILPVLFVPMTGEIEKQE